MAAILKKLKKIAISQKPLSKCGLLTIKRVKSVNMRHGAKFHDD